MWNKTTFVIATLLALSMLMSAACKSEEQAPWRSLKIDQGIAGPVYDDHLQRASDCQIQEDDGIKEAVARFKDYDRQNSADTDDLELIRTDLSGFIAYVDTACETKRFKQESDEFLDEMGKQLDQVDKGLEGLKPPNVE